MVATDDARDADELLIRNCAKTKIAGEILYFLVLIFGDGCRFLTRKLREQNL